MQPLRRKYESFLFFHTIQFQWAFSVVTSIATDWLETDSNQMVAMLYFLILPIVGNVGGSKDTHG